MEIGAVRIAIQPVGMQNFADENKNLNFFKNGGGLYCPPPILIFKTLYNSSVYENNFFDNYNYSPFD